MFQRLRVAIFAPIALACGWYAVVSDWNAGYVVSALAALLAVDAVYERQKDEPRSAAATLVADSTLIAAGLAIGMLPVAVMVAVFSLLIGAGALLLDARDTVRFFAWLGALGVVVGRVASNLDSPWSDAQIETLTVLSIGIIPLIIVVTIVMAGREAGVSRVLVRRLNATEAALRATEQRFGRAFGSAPSGLVIIDLDGSIVQANKAFADLVGASIEGLTGASLFEFIDPTDNELTDDDFERLLDDGSSAYLHDRRLVTRDGRHVWTVMSVSLVEDADGSASRCIVHVMDVTERRSSLEALNASNRRLDALHQITRAGLGAQDVNDASTSIAHVISEVFGFPRVSICVHDPSERMMRSIAAVSADGPFQHDVPVDAALCARAALTNESWHKVDPRGVGSKVNPELRSILSVPLHIDDERTGSLSLSDYEIRDIDDDLIEQISNVADHVAAFLRRMRVEEQLAALIRSKDQFIASVSHEVRTPLTAVVGLAAELRDRYHEMEPGESTEILEIVAEQSTEVANIVEDLLVAARSDLDNLNLKNEHFRVGAQIDQVIREMERTPGARAVEATIEVDVMVQGDRGRFRQIVRNLLSNAIRYGGEHIRVEVGHRGHAATVTVVDDGEGVPEGDWERIFEPYRRSHNAVSQPGSVGIGLTVSRKLARLMGGDLTYRHADGHSRFELVLPMAVEGDYVLGRSA